VKRPVFGIDIGNGGIKVFPLPSGRAGFAARPALVDGGERWTLRAETGGELWDQLPATVRTARLHLVSVRPQLALDFMALAEDAGAEAHLWTTEDIPLAHPYEDPSRLGADRLLAAFAARALHGAPAVILDAGTALTVDVLGPEGRFEGGAIAPGWPLLREALGRGAMLEVAAAHSELAYPGRDTADALAAGALGALLGGARELVRRAQDFVGEEAPVLVTGGDGALICRELAPLADDWILEPRLLEWGLAYLESMR
jgi:type III pantothenate kinase